MFIGIFNLEIIRKKLIISIFMVFSLLLVNTSFADVFYVKTSGIKATGSSTPGEWADGNCYPTLLKAAGNATDMNDAIYLFNETHTISGQITIQCGWIYNQNGDNDYNNAVVTFNSGIDSYLNNDSSSGADLSITGITFQDQKRVSSAVYISNSTSERLIVLFDFCKFYNNTGNDFGGGIEVHTTNELIFEVENCYFENNSALQRGGAIWIYGPVTTTIENTSFVNNIVMSSDSRGGAIYAESSAASGSLDVSDCIFIENEAVRMGGAILSMDIPSTNILYSSFERNNVNVDGSISFANAAVNIRRWKTVDENCYATIKNCVFDGNISRATDTETSDGGGLITRGIDQNDMMIADVEDCEFVNNYANQGAGYYIGRYSAASINRCIFENNTARCKGGALYKGGNSIANVGETAETTYCAFIGNKAGYNLDGTECNASWCGSGGAIYIRYYPRAFLYNCSFLNNVVGGDPRTGDALSHEGTYSDDSQCELVNCLFYGIDGNDVQIRFESEAFSNVDYCAFESGEFVCVGVNPTNTLTLTENPCESFVDAHLTKSSPCETRAAVVPGIHNLYPRVRDLDGNPIIGNPIIGAYHPPNFLWWWWWRWWWLFYSYS